MLVSVAIAMAFSYPTILLADNPTAGLASYPHHVWTTAKPFDDNPGHADVEMRQVWIHGSYMRALEKPVLKSGLDIQQALIDGDSWTSVFPSLRSSTLSWGYHSPLMYWNNSRQMIDNDNDILTTINRQSSTTSSSLNVALRPASVFAGKKFDHRKLTAADALVITLINKVQDGVGSQWRDRMVSLSTGACRDCTLFPEDGHITRNRVYEFSFTPLSVKENIAFTFAYSCMALYVLLSLRRIKAFHSRFGLVVTVITQMTCSILASLTICGILKINLSMIPQNAYPFVVLVIGLENMFRIINAVLAYPPTMATELRIANALGDVGPVSVATATQNLIILSLLAKVVSPGVAAFCTFACIATLFDAFFLLTFFVAVLMVDIRRFELQDALTRANQIKHRRKPSPVHHHTWFDALVHGRLPFTTRMAGTAVTTTFILSLNYHFFEHKEQATSLPHLLRLIKNGPPNMSDFDTFTPLPINATMTPGQWMRMQDFDTAKEVMRLAKPGADSFIIRIFAPLIVVLPGADRTGIDQQEWTTALRSFARHHFYPVATAVVFAVAFVAVLMNFLLYTENEDERRSENEEEDALIVNSIHLPHRLDIIKLSGTDKGHFVSVALDKTIVISLFNKIGKGHRILCLADYLLSSIHWPIYMTTLEKNGEWVAFHCSDDRIMIYGVASGSFLDEILPYPDDNPTLLFEFVRLSCGEAKDLHLIVLTSGGRLVMLDVDTGKSSATKLADIPLVGAKVVELPTHGKMLMLVTDEGDIVSHSWNGAEWTWKHSQSLSIPTAHGRLTGAVHIEQCSELGSDLLVITAATHAIFLNSASLTILNKFEAGESAPSINSILFDQCVKCPACGLLSSRCATILGEVSSDGDCLITTMRSSKGNDEPICIRNGSPSCSSFHHVQKTSHRLSKPGAWCVVGSQGILGLRKHVPEVDGSANSRRKSSMGRVRRRRHIPFDMQTNDREDSWEAYEFSADGELETIAVPTDEGDPNAGAALYVTSAGPAVPLDSQSAAVAFGNTVKVIRSIRRGSKARRLTGRTLARLPAADSNDEVRGLKVR